VARSCEHCNEPSGSIKFWRFLVAERLVHSEEGLGSMEFVSL
jgi:hypothetical protein